MNRFFFRVSLGLKVKKFTARTFSTFAVSAAFVLFFSGYASAECPSFPKFSFWGNLSHVSVKNYVETRMDGDWPGYIEKLEKIKTGLESIHLRGKAAVLKLKGNRVTLQGENLSDYIQMSEKRLNVARCLAEEVEMAELQNFATAAGGNNTPDSSQELSSNFLLPAEREQKVYRTYVTLPGRLVSKLNKRATRLSYIENRTVSVNDVITRSLQRRFAN
ncbi:MAG: hypothetical protein H8E39_03225 [Alphaproteobacteria bacterium]|nr:hypothetical protein [Alphaproteobacteria bacterium]